jgi:hypothetical protein
MVRRRLEVEIVREPGPNGESQRALLIDGAPLMGAAEVAEALGVRVQNIRFVRGLPDAVSYQRASRIWLGSEIYDFIDAREADGA